MITFMFWNLGRRSLETRIANLAARNQIDVIMLAECVQGSSILSELQEYSTAYRFVKQIGCTKIDIFIRFPTSFIPPLTEEPRVTIRNLKLPGLTDILLAVVHQPSKMHWEDEDQLVESGQLARLIEKAEEQIGHSRTVLVGDFNMNPFEAGIVSAGALHGVMCRKIAQEKSRTVQRRRYLFFYNPMWGLLGDATPGPPGTYHYKVGKHKVFFWNMFDQVLIRPDLLNRFANTDLEILTSDGHSSLLGKTGLPDSKEASDHLPLLFRLAL